MALRTKAQRPIRLPPFKFDRWDQKHMDEQIRVGEHFGFGPGYAQCISDYFEREIPHSNLMLDVAAATLGLARKRIAPVIANSLGPGQYLHGIIEPEKIVPVSPDLDIVICKNPADARKLRLMGPILLPISSTRQAILRLLDGVLTTQYDQKFRADMPFNKELIRQLVSEYFDVPPANVLLHLGANEVLKAIFRASHRQMSVAMPIPNYLDAMIFSSRFGHPVFPLPYSMGPTDGQVDAWCRHLGRNPPDILYLSNPNNPFGYYLTYDNFSALLTSLPPASMVVVDQTNIGPAPNPGIQFERLRKAFPAHRIAIVDSFSKSHDLVSHRIGFGFFSNLEDLGTFLRLEPPGFTYWQNYELGRALMMDPAVYTTVKKAQDFYRFAMKVKKRHKDDITIIPSNSNFCIVRFHDQAKAVEFLDRLGDWKRVKGSMVPKVAGLPKVGSGDLVPDDLDKNGAIRPEVFFRGGIIGLSSNHVRLSALSDLSVLKVLDDCFL